MPIFKVKYQAGTYSGTRTVCAYDEDEAIQKVRREIRSSMSLPMYSDSYKVVESNYVEDDEDED
jgi:hypothetical protein